MEAAVQHLEQQMLKTDETLDNLAAKVGHIETELFSADVFGNMMVPSSTVSISGSETEVTATDCEVSGDDTAVISSSYNHGGDAAGSAEAAAANVHVLNLLQSVRDVKDNYQTLRREISEVQGLQRELSSSLEQQIRQMQSKCSYLKEKLMLPSDLAMNNMNHQHHPQNGSGSGMHRSGGSMMLNGGCAGDTSGPDLIKRP